MAPRVENHLMERSRLSGIDVFSMCPASTEVTHDLYLQQVIDVARWGEAWGCAGTLINAGNSLVDPWLVAYTIIRHTRTLCPLVAVQPLYMHPHAVAKIVSTIGCRYGRRVLLNAACY
jgi:alkanesulfonate monooxygenase